MLRWLFIAMGLHALVAQVVLLREMLVVLSGHELALGMILAFWLLGVFLGAWRSASDEGSKPSGVWPLCALLGTSTVTTLVLLLAVRHLRVWIPAVPGAPLPALGFIFAMLAFLLPQGAMVGAMFPVASALAARVSSHPAMAIGRVYCWEAGGSLMGGILLTFLLIPHLYGPAILAWCGIGAALLGAWGVFPLNKRAAMALGVLGAFWAGMLLSGLAGRLQDWSVQRRWEALHPWMERIATVDTPYQSVELGRMEGQLTVFGNGRPIATFPDPVEAAPLVHLLMHQEPEPRRVLLLGGGPASTIPLLLRYPLETLQVVELDPMVFKVAKPFLTQEMIDAFSDPRLKLHHADARFLIQRIPSGSFDAVVVQMPDPSTTLLNRFHTVEFFQSLSRILGPRGLVIHGVTGSVHYLGPELEAFLGMIYRSLREIFPEVRVIPGERTLFLASKESGLIVLDPQKLGSRCRLRESGEEIPSGLFHLWIQPQQVGLWEETLGKTLGPLNRDEHPRSTLHFLALWEKLSGARFGAQVLRWLEGVPWWGILGLLGVLMTCAFLGRGRMVLERSTLLAVGVTGLTAMAQEMACLYLYQAVWGYLYSRLGLLIGTFMAGLALGARGGVALGDRERDWLLGALLGVQVSMGLLCMAIPLIWVPMLLGQMPLRPPGWPMEAAICLWMLFAGLATGATFPLACGAMAQEPGSTRRTAGIASAWDHLGGALGAILGGVALVPALGLARVGLVLAGLQGLAALWVAIHVLAEVRRQG